MVIGKSKKPAPKRGMRRGIGDEGDGEVEVPDEMLVVIGERITTLRKLQGMSQRELAEKTGLTLTTIYLVEQGRRNSSIIALREYASALGVTISALLPDDQRDVSINSNVLGSLCDGLDELSASFRRRADETLADIDDTSRLFKGLMGRRGKK